MLIVLFATVMTGVASVRAIAGTGATIVGTVTLTAADGAAFPGEGARVMLACPADGTARTEVSDEHGAFRFRDAPVDSCSIQAELQGFVGQPVGVVTAARRVVGTDLHLGIAPLRAGVNVAGTGPVPAPSPLARSCRSDGRRLERSSKRCSH
jgi:Carboxypeptidase regulatory-like domain